jgi:hypothetical protein
MNMGDIEEGEGRPLVSNPPINDEEAPSCGDVSMQVSIDGCGWYGRLIVRSSFWVFLSSMVCDTTLNSLCVCAVRCTGWVRRRAM